MAQFEAEIRIQDLSEVDALTARRAMEDKLRAAGFQRWKVVRISPQRPSRKAFKRPLTRPLPNGSAHMQARNDSGQGIWIVIAALAWAIWFVWLLGG